MSESIDLKGMPSTFGMCNIEECPEATNCLRQTAFKVHKGEHPFISVLSKKWIENQNWKCKIFLSNKKQRLPRGFIRTIKLIPTGKFASFRMSAIMKLGYRRYYQARKGEVVLTPTEAKYIVDLAKKCGVNQEDYFDAYEETYLWN